MVGKIPHLCALTQLCSWSPHHSSFASFLLSIVFILIFSLFSQSHYIRLPIKQVTQNCSASWLCLSFRLQCLLQASTDAVKIIPSHLALSSTAPLHRPKTLAFDWSFRPFHPALLAPWVPLALNL